MSTKEAIKLEKALEPKARMIFDALCIAFGGASQFGPEEIGKAVAGHVRNQDQPAVLAKVVLKIYQDQWAEIDLPENLLNDELAVVRHHLTRAIGETSSERLRELLNKGFLREMADGRF